MKRILFVIIACLACSIAIAQNYKDVVYLKNGSIIKGLVIEQIPNQNIKIQTADGSLFVYEMEQVEKITKELVTATEQSVTPVDATLEWVNDSKIKVSNDLSSTIFRTNDPKLRAYFDQGQYDKFYRSTKILKTGKIMTICGATSLGISAVFFATSPFIYREGFMLIGGSFAGLSCALLGMGIPFWCVGANHQKKVINDVNYSNGKQFTLQFTPSVQSMNTGMITGRNDMAVGATLAFRF